LFRLLGVAAAGILLTQPAFANWKYTSWGMTPEQVAAASKGTVKVGSGEAGDRMDGYDVGDTGQYVSGNYQFDATFYFQRNGLALVHLTLNGGGDQCNALRLDLEGFTANRLTRLTTRSREARLGMMLRLATSSTY